MKGKLYPFFFFCIKSEGHYFSHLTGKIGVFLRFEILTQAAKLQEYGGSSIWVMYSPYLLGPWLNALKIWF